MQPAVKRVADANEQPHADEVEEAVNRVEPDHDDGDADQRRHALRGQHAVVDLQHVKRAGQAKDVDHGGENADAKQRAGAVPQRRHQFISRRFWRNRLSHRMSSILCARMVIISGLDAQSAAGFLAPILHHLALPIFSLLTLREPVLRLAAKRQLLALNRQLIPPSVFWRVSCARGHCDRRRAAAKRNWEACPACCVPTNVCAEPPQGP